MPSYRDIKQMIWSQIFGRPALPEETFDGKTVIITGANTGVGFEAAKHVARLKASHLILACRSIDKGREAVSKITDEVHPSGIVEVWQLDLADYQSVLSFGRRVSQLPRLDGFIANAGLELQEVRFNEGLETQLCVNVVSTMLNALSAIPKLQETSRKYNQQTNLTFQGSAYHIFGPDRELDIPADFDILDKLSQQPMDIMGRYALSKLLMHQCAHELANRVEDVVVNITHPGWAATELSRSKASISWGERIGFALIGWSAEKGSRSCVYAVTAGRMTHNCYLSEGEITPESEFMRSDRGQEIQKRVWGDLMLRIRRISPEVAWVVETPG